MIKGRLKQYNKDGWKKKNISSIIAFSKDKPQ